MKNEIQYDRDRACKFALSSLSHSDSSKKALYNKLILKGFSKEDAAFAIEYVTSYGYVDEKRQIERIATDLCERQNIGKKKIFARLLSKGYRQSDVSEVISSLVRDGRINFELARARLLQKYPSDITEEQRKKILFKNGYTDV